MLIDTDSAHVILYIIWCCAIAVVRLWSRFTTMSDARRGLPLLSESPPTFAPPDSETACRKCNKEFSLIFVRSRKCNHCGASV